MGRTITAGDKHDRIVKSGIDEIRKVLFGNDEKLIQELLLCLDYYLDPYYKHHLPYEKEIYDLLQELAVTNNNGDIIEDCLGLIGNYMVSPTDILHDKFDEIKDNMKPYARCILEQR